MLPASLLSKAIQLCAAGLGTGGAPAPATYPIVVRTGAFLKQAPRTQADAVATVRDLLASGADFDAGPLAINGRDFVTYGVSPVAVFDACALSRTDAEKAPSPVVGPTTVAAVSAMVRQAFGARITDTIRPMNASYGARYSWHKVGQAIDFVPAAGVGSITREQVRALMAAAGIRIIELLGPGDRGHSNHWHLAFARPGQVIDRLRSVEGDEDWVVDVAESTPAAPMLAMTDARVPPGVAAQPDAKAPPPWDVFAAAEWHGTHGGGS